MAEPAVHAERGIPCFWRIDDGPRLQAHRLDPDTGGYRLYPTWGRVRGAS